MTMTWRAMARPDMALVQTIATVVHPGYPESADVFHERLSMYPAGCLVLEDEQGTLVGYAISHPWHRGQAPALDSLLESLPPAASTYYLHDIALLPQARGQGAPSSLLALLLKQAEVAGLDEMSLVAVNGSQPYWQGQHFEVLREPALMATLRSYGEDVCLMRRRLKP